MRGGVWYGSTMIEPVRERNLGLAKYYFLFPLLGQPDTNPNRLGDIIQGIDFVPCKSLSYMT